MRVLKRWRDRGRTVGYDPVASTSGEMLRLIPAESSWTHWGSNRTANRYSQRPCKTDPL